MAAVNEGRLAIDGQARLAHRDFEDEQPVVAQGEVLAVRDAADQVAAEQEGGIVRRPALAQLLGDEVVAILPGVDPPLPGFVVVILVTRDDEVGAGLAGERKLALVGVLAKPVIGIEEAHILAARGLERRLDRPVLAPVVGADGDDVRLRLQPVPGPVGAAVVDDDDLDVSVGGAARLDGLRQGPQAIEGRNNDGDVAHAVTLADSRRQKHRRLRAHPRRPAPANRSPCAGPAPGASSPESRARTEAMAEASAGTSPSGATAPVDAGLDEVGPAADGIGHHRGDAAGHRLVDHQPPGLDGDRRQDDDVGRGIDRRQLALVDEAQEPRVDAAGASRLFHPALTARPRPQRRGRPAGLRRTEPRDRLRHVQRPLAVHQPADEQHAPPAIGLRYARPGPRRIARAPEGIVVDAVRREEQPALPAPRSVRDIPRLRWPT